MKVALWLNHSYRSALVNSQLAIRDVRVRELSWCISTSIYWKKGAQMSVCSIHGLGPPASEGVALKERQEQDFRHQLSKESLWLNNACQNAWVSPNVITWDVGKSEPPGSSPILSCLDGTVDSIPWDVSHGKVRALPFCGGSPQMKRQDLFWHDLCLRPTEWLDSRPDMRLVRHPDFRHTTSKEALWLKDGDETVWMDSDLAPRESVVVRNMWPKATLTKRMESGSWTEAGYERDPKDGTLSRLWKEGELKEIVEGLDLLVQQRCQINKTIFYHVLKRCMSQKDLVLGRRIHALVLRSGYESNAFLANHFIGMYASHGKLEEAMQVFRKVPKPNAFMWASIILAHARHGQAIQALYLYHQMREESSVKPDNYIFVAVLKACATAGDLAFGKEVHAEIEDNAARADVFVGNGLVNMYAKCGSLEDARKVFDRLPMRNVVTWTTMIAAYTHHGLGQEALALYARMQRQGMTPADHVGFACLLQACASVRALHEGKQLHAQIQERRLEHDVLVGNSLVDMYAKCGSLEDALIVFDTLPKRDVVTWNAMIAGYVQHEHSQEALGLYARMQQEGKIAADRVTFICLLKACASLGAVQQGKELHRQIHKAGLETDTDVGNSLVNMYAKCGSLEDARQVFDRLSTRDVVTWTAMIGGYSQQGLGQEALALYADMQEEGMTPANRVTFRCLLQACATIGALHHGKELHAQIRERGLEGDVGVGCCLVDMYAKCGSLADAQKVFTQLPVKDVVHWNSMIAGYVHHGLGQEALVVYASMQQDGMTLADHLTFVCVLQACAIVGALGEGKEIHGQIKERGLEANLLVGNGLVDMYAKCGSLKDALLVFHRLPTKDVVTWNVLLHGYSEHSDGEGAIKWFQKMLKQSVEPNDITFLCILKACSHAGFVHEGQQYFQMMGDYGIVPTDYHYNCMVDLLGRSGHLDEAESMLRTAPFESLVVGWTSLLSACKSHGDEERGRRCFDTLIQLEPEYTSAYVLLGNIYANAGRWREVDRVERLRRYAGALKKPARACIEVKNKVHEFTVGEERSDVSSKIRSVNLRLKEDGEHVPQTELVLKSMSQQEKEDALCGHAEKLALAYGLLNTSDGTTLLVTKNLRMCNDCHSSTKTMSRLEKREIVVRDAHRVHRFLDGACSCGDRY